MKTADLKFDDRMPRKLHVAVCNTLMREMDPGRCTHTHALTERALRRNKVADTAPAIAWLKEHGGYCDCEVVMNTVPFDDAGPV
jgi:hypothetical protein